MDARRAIALLLSVMGVLRVAPAVAADGPGGYIYDLVARGSNLSIVINVRGDIAGIQDRRDADPSVESGESSGSIGDCSDVTFFCIDGPLLIRVPRDLGLTGSKQGSECTLVGQDV